MKIIYQFKERIKEDPEYIRKAQELTLNESKPKAGLKGTFGLLGSDEWWSNLNNGLIPQKEISGIITKVYLTGQDNTEKFNTIDIKTDDGNIYTEGTYTNKNSENHYYKPGAKVTIKYAFDPLKKPKPDGETDYSKIVIEIAISQNQGHPQNA
ncbi:hypothetical protein KTQ74_08515 [Pseudomonas chlororaphis]|uniref:hypothetical protein n=1 Tax=Pseudomonas chlororaphis TaxID=587753 RepID=UPI001E55ED48|nr:hypothetical protein [Pseudomonas chlororaphis]MCB2251934.1 hypothetical protein [Pseudomonas chlororaphis]